MTVKIKIKKLDEGATIPTRANEHDVGYDIYALDKTILRAFETKIVKTGLSVEIPPGYELQIRGKSGNAAKRGYTIAQGIGTIDPGYRGEVGVIIKNNNLTITSHALQRTFAQADHQIRFINIVFYIPDGFGIQANYF